MQAAADEIRTRLKRWPRGVDAEPRSFAEAALEAAGAMFESSPVILAWEDPEEPWVVIASRQDGAFSWREEPGVLDTVCSTLRDPGRIEVAVDGESIHGCMFIASPANRPEWMVILAD